MRINMQSGGQNTLIVEGLSTGEFIIGDYITIHEKERIFSFNLKCNSPIVNIMYEMMKVPQPFSIIIMSGMKEVVNFKECVFEVPSIVIFSFKFSEMIVFKSEQSFPRIGISAAL